MIKDITTEDLLQELVRRREQEVPQIVEQINHLIDKLLKLGVNMESDYDKILKLNLCSKPNKVLVEMVID